MDVKDDTSSSKSIGDVADLTASQSTPPTQHGRPENPINMSSGAMKLRSWLNRLLRIEMVDRRVLIGIFVCTDRDANVILSSCGEYLPDEEPAADDVSGVAGASKEASSSTVNGGEPQHSCEESRILGLVMVPGKHIVSIALDESNNSIASTGCVEHVSNLECGLETPLAECILDSAVS